MKSNKGLEEERAKELASKEEEKKEENKEETKEVQAEAQPSYYGMYQPEPLAKPSGDLLEKAISIFEGKLITHMKEVAKERTKLHDEQKSLI